MSTIFAVRPTNRARLTVYAIGAAFRSGLHIGEGIPVGKKFSIEGATHVVRGSNPGDAMRDFLASQEAGALNLDNWRDDDTSQRLLYICPVESLPFIQTNMKAEIETSMTHKHRNGAPIRYVRCGY